VVTNTVVGTVAGVVSSTASLEVVVKKLDMVDIKVVIKPVVVLSGVCG